MDPHVYTALPIAAARAVAHQREAAYDPLAHKLVAGETQLFQQGANVGYMTLRKQIGDDLVLQQHEQFGSRQVVSLGAGMDSRAFRLGLDDTTFFEVDRPGLFEVKEPLVADVPLQCASRNTVPGVIGEVDLVAALIAAGFDRTQPTTWLLEGLLPYLSEEVVRKLAADMGRLSARGSAMWGDGFSKTSVEKGMSFHGVPFVSGFDDYDDVFRKAGFETASAFAMSGAFLRKNEADGGGKLHGADTVWIDPRCEMTAERLRGQESCVMVRAYKLR